MNATEKLPGTVVFTEDAEESDDTSGWASEKERGGERARTREEVSLVFSITALSRPFQHLRLCDMCNSRRPFRHVVEEEFTDICATHRNRFSGDKKLTFRRLFFL